MWIKIKENVSPWQKEEVAIFCKCKIIRLLKFENEDPYIITARAIKVWI
jgi:hypothetical protein